MYPKITVTCEDTKKSFDEIAIARVSIMAHESLNPDEFENFLFVYNVLIERRSLQNQKIT